MNKWMLTTFILLLTFMDVQAQNYLQAKEELPQDVAMALEFLQLNSPPSKDWESDIRELDQLLRYLSKEERLMVLKAELYKAILKTSRGENVQRPTYRRQTLERLKKNFQNKNDEKWDPFSTYFVQALITDLELIMQDAYYPNFLNELRSNRSLSSQSRSFKQRLDGLLPWVQWYFEGSLPGLKQKLLQTSEMALRLFNQRAKNLIFMTQFEMPNLDQDQGLQFFQAKATPGKTESDEASEAPLEQLDVDIPPAPKAPFDEKWVPKVAPDPDYEAPENLPEPVDDWLPKPVDDWLDDM